MFNDKTVVTVHPNKIEDFLKQKFERVETFIDDEGNLFLVRKGDLDLYWLRKERKEKLNKTIKENEFLKDEGPFLDFEIKF